MCKKQRPPFREQRPLQAKQSAAVPNPAAVAVATGQAAVLFVVEATYAALSTDLTLELGAGDGFVSVGTVACNG